MVELMVALAIGLLILFGVGQIFVASKQSYNQMEALASRQQSLRAISDLVSLDVRTSTDVVDNTSDKTVLEMAYSGGARSSDPYCTGGSDLLEVKYDFDSSGGELLVDVNCGGGYSGGQALIGDLEDVVFDVGLDSSGSSAGGLYVEMSVTFPEMSVGEPLDNRQYTFMVARRENILH